MFSIFSCVRFFKVYIGWKNSKQSIRVVQWKISFFDKAFIFYRKPILSTFLSLERFVGKKYESKLFVINHVIECKFEIRHILFILWSFFLPVSKFPLAWRLLWNAREIKSSQWSRSYVIRHTAKGILHGRSQAFHHNRPATSADRNLDTPAENNFESRTKKVCRKSCKKFCKNSYRKFCRNFCTIFCENTLQKFQRLFL